MGPVLRRWTFACTLSRLLQFSAALPRGHATLAFVDVGVGFADRAAVVAVGFVRIYVFLHISICIPLRPYRPLSTEHSKGNKSVPGKVATTRTEDGHK